MVKKRKGGEGKGGGKKKKKNGLLKAEAKGWVRVMIGLDILVIALVLGAEFPMPCQRKLLPYICQPYTDFLHISSSVPGGSGCGGKPSSIGLSYPGMEGCGQGGSDLPHGGRAAQSPGALCGGRAGVSPGSQGRRGHIQDKP